MLNSRDYRVISLALNYLLANRDDVERLDSYGGMADLSGQRVPTEVELQMLLKRTRGKIKELESSER